jgi:hypothetical protein
MKSLPWLLLLSAALLAAAGCHNSRSATPFNCIGHWKVSDGAGQTYYITLKDDRTASSTLPHHGEGTWSVEKINIRIVWQNRWIDYLVVTEGAVTRVGCAPGDNLEDIPENSSAAVRVDSVPAQ